MTSSKFSAGYLIKPEKKCIRFTDLPGSFRFGDRDVRECIGAAMDLYMSPVVMQSVTGGATCDAADTSGNDVPIQWRVANPDDIS